MHGRPPLLHSCRAGRTPPAVLLIAVVVLIVVLDVIVEGYEVSPPVLVPLLLTRDLAEAAEVSYGDRGEHVLKGVSGTKRVFSVGPIAS